MIISAPVEDRKLNFLVKIPMPILSIYCFVHLFAIWLIRFLDFQVFVIFSIPFQDRGLKFSETNQFKILLVDVVKLDGLFLIWFFLKISLGVKVTEEL